jgi:hypothetical protein
VEAEALGNGDEEILDFNSSMDTSSRHQQDLFVLAGKSVGIRKVFGEAASCRQSESRQSRCVMLANLQLDNAPAPSKNLDMSIWKRQG